MSSLKPIATSSLAEIAFTNLVEAISGGEFEPGQRLSEADLARRFGISRGPLREALQRLEGRLVVRQPRVGVSVIQFSPQALRDLFTVREALEGMAARLATENMRKRDVRVLRTLLARHAEEPELATGTGYRQHSFDDDFHFRIVKLAGNERLESLLADQLYYQLRLYRFRSSVKTGRARTAFEEHVAIVDAMEQGDPERAEQAMRAHIRHAYDSLAERARAEAGA